MGRQIKAIYTPSVSVEGWGCGALTGRAWAIAKFADGGEGWIELQCTSEGLVYNGELGITWEELAADKESGHRANDDRPKLYTF